ncbi:MAG: serine/threonine-protein kinase [Phycisphaeraceae bacterium]|nr:serine/threonine-protein kinase [Phycisphaeraceae bacterium]MCB9847202.1 serine/threonine-protein kinase [Phycisphaeraceae bacterium]
MTDPPKQLGPYTIDREIGRGGMGVVYLGHDTRLDRPVAIKALPEHLAQDPDRLARFEREAKTLASLNHPNVAGIFGVESDGGAKYLILEYVEGETLADRLDRGPLPIDEAIEIAVQIAAGIEAAHEAGVIHRDLKPANIKITPDDRVKVLDFGLAKANEAQSTSSTNFPTLSSPAVLNSPTIPGAIMGTAPYMSPEQARGRSVDKRTDIWSFGVVLYEMLSGVGPFHGETVTDSIGAILHKDPDRALLPANTPRAVHRVLDRCLERDRNKRLRDIGDARLELERADHTRTGDNADTPAPPRGVHPALVTLLILLFSAIGAGVVLLTRTSPPQPPVVRATIEPPENAGVVFTGDLAGPAVIARDGGRLAFVAQEPGKQQQLYIRDLDAETPRRIKGAEGAMFPFWSWDGNEIGYFTAGELRVYDTLTRTNRSICPSPGGRGGAWLADGTIVFTPGFQSPIYRVPSKGGEPTPVTAINPDRHTSHRWPCPTRNGDNFIYIAVSHELGKFDESAIFLATPPGQPDIEVTRARFGGKVSGDQLLIIRGDTLTSTTFDERTGRLTGSPETILTGIASDPATWNAPFSASETGVLTFHKQTDQGLRETSPGSAPSLGEAVRTQLIARDGRLSANIADGVPQNSLAISPNADYIAISGRPGANSARDSFDIWLYQVPSSMFVPLDDRETDTNGDPLDDVQRKLSQPPLRLTFLDTTEVCPLWSPDGEWIAFGQIARIGNSNTNKIYKVRISSGSPTLILEFPNGYENAAFPADWSEDGRYLIYVRGSWIDSGDKDIYMLDLETNESTPVVAGEGDQNAAEISPDGKWLLYTSNESGITEVYVIPFRPGWRGEEERGEPTPAAAAKWRVSIAGAGRARWSPLGDELFYIARSNSMIAVPVRTEGTDFIHGAGSALFQITFDSSSDFDVFPNGRGFAINAPSDRTSGTMNILTNWRALLVR